MVRRAVLAAALAWALAACVAAPGRVGSEGSGPVYPKEAPARDLDIVVVRDGAAIELTNRTAAAYADVEVWLNQQYAQRVERLPVGQTVRVSLLGFINRDGEVYPVGGLLSPDKTMPVLLAELYLPAERREGGEGEPAPNLALEPGVRYRLLVRTKPD